MVARPSSRVASERWSGHWGADARYHARRSDGACYSIDGAVRVSDLARAVPAAPLARPLPALDADGRYALCVVGTREEPPREDVVPRAGARREGRRLVACGVRRAARR